MNKHIFFSMLAVFSILSMGAFKPLGSIDLKIVNKSGVEIGIQLIDPTDDKNFYYLTVPEGDVKEPQEKDFEVKSASMYRMIVHYVETWDPVYGYAKCNGLIRMSKLIAIRSQRIVFTECTRMPRHPGEPSMLKYWTYTPYKYPYKYIH